MKVGILTFHNANNYGAVLQAWALKEYIMSRDLQVEIIDYRLPVIENLYKPYKPRRPFKNRFLNKGFHVLQFIKAIIRDLTKVKKYYMFQRFINQFLNPTKPITSYKHLKKASLAFDILIAGSDQIWNSEITKGLQPVYFLAFGKKSTKRISYAASIGKDNIAREEVLFFKRYLRDIDYISVREEKAKEAIGDLTENEITVVTDPTLLLEKESYDKLKRFSNIKHNNYIFVYNVHLKRVDQNLNNIAKEMSKRLGLPIINNRNDYTFKNELKKFTYGDPREYIGYIDNAGYVITNSFHTTLFSIIYNKNFITVPHFKNPERMKHFLNAINLGNHLIGNANALPENLKELEIDYFAVAEKIKIIKEKSKLFLNQALDGDKTTNKAVKYEDLFFKTKDVFSCYGCSACKDLCPEAAISMEADKEGFWYPNINEESCTNCNICRDSCIYHKYIAEEYDLNYPKVYAAYNKDEAVLESSASGGVFTPLFKYFVNNGGKVVGVKYDENMKAIYDIADNENDCNAFRGSKYVAAENKDVNMQVEELLDKGVNILFSGTPCKIAGLKSFLKKEYDNLFTCELICMGTPSPKIFKRYLFYLEKLYKSKVIDLQFRNKFRGWNNSYILVKFISEEIFLERLFDNKYGKAFSKKYTLRPCCYTCEFASLKKGVGDITIGDYWGIEDQLPEMFNPKGVSIVKINNNKGFLLFNQIKEHFETKESNYELAYAKNHREPALLTIERNSLMSKIDDVEIEELLS